VFSIVHSCLPGFCEGKLLFPEERRSGKLDSSVPNGVWRHQTIWIPFLWNSFHLLEFQTGPNFIIKKWGQTCSLSVLASCNLAVWKCNYLTAKLNVSKKSKKNGNWTPQPYVESIWHRYSPYTGFASFNFFRVNLDISASHTFSPSNWTYISFSSFNFHGPSLFTIYMLDSTESAPYLEPSEVRVQTICPIYKWQNGAKYHKLARSPSHATLIKLVSINFISIKIIRLSSTISSIPLNSKLSDYPRSVQCWNQCAVN
jgi:hypothetical protein